MADLDLAALRGITDPLLRAREAHRAIPVVEEIRDQALAEARQGGMSLAALGEAIGLTGERVRQILKGSPGPERAFWGADDDRLIIAVGRKTEAPKKASGPAGPVVAVEDMAAYEALREHVAAYGISTCYETIAPPGFVDLNRSGLVVICGPRLSPMVGQVLASDRNLAFGHDDTGWYLHDLRSGTWYRSPIDDGEHADIAYVGRLPRPDGRGTFMYVAGIHAVGAPGAIHYLAANLAEMWQQVRTRRFSALVRCTFEPDTRAVTGSELIAGPYEGA